MTRHSRLLAAAALLLALAACNQGKQETDAGGEVLEGSASDAMLPLDTVRSQAPLAPRAESSGKADEDGKQPAASSEAAPAASEAAPEVPVPASPAATQE